MHNISEFTTADLLLDATGNPFQNLRTILHNELYPSTTKELLIAAKVFTAIYACCLVFTLMLLGVRFRRGEHQLYRLVGTARGPLIVPHVTHQFLLSNIFFVPLIFPYTWLNCLRNSGDLTNAQLWFCLIWVPLFWGAWHICWSTVTGAALLDASSNPDSVGASWKSTKIVRSIPAWISNTFFIFVLFTSCVAEIGISVAATLKWNRGIKAYNNLDAQLVAAQIQNSQTTGDATTILSVIPDSDLLLHEIANAIFGFELPRGVCLTFAILATLIMFLAAFWQIRTLGEQIKTLRQSIGRLLASSQDGTAVSLNLSLSSNTQRHEELIGTLRNVMFTSIALCLSMLAFITACVVGQLTFNSTPILHRFKTSTGHLFVVFFIYAIVNLIVLSFIGRQTFTSASHATRSRRSTTMGSSANSASKFAISLPSSYPGSPASARFDSSYPGSPASARFDEKELELNSITSPHLTIPVFQT